MGNDIGPPNLWMVWTGSISLVSGALMNANVLGTIADILVAIDQSACKF